MTPPPTGFRCWSQPSCSYGQIWRAALRLQREQGLVRVEQARAVLLVDDLVVEHVEDASRNESRADVCVRMTTLHPGQRGIDRGGLLRLSERLRIERVAASSSFSISCKLTRTLATVQ